MVYRVLVKLCKNPFDNTLLICRYNIYVSSKLKYKFHDTLVYFTLWCCKFCVVIDLKKYISINVKQVSWIMTMWHYYLLPLRVLKPLSIFQQSNQMIDMAKACSMHEVYVKNVQNFSGKTTKIVPLWMPRNWQQDYININLKQIWFCSCGSEFYVVSSKDTNGLWIP